MFSRASRSFFILILTAIAAMYYQTLSFEKLYRNPFSHRDEPNIQRIDLKRINRLLRFARNDKTNYDTVIHTPEQIYLLNGPIDINQATQEDLEAIPRIGPALAKRIIEYRNQHGPIHSLDKLIEVKGVGPVILKIIGKYIKVSQRHET